MAAASRKSADAAVPLPAVAAILLLVAISGVQIRLDPASGIMLLLYVLGGAVVVPWTLAAAAGERRTERLSGATTTLILASLSIVLSALVTLAELLGAEGGPGSTFWVSLVFAAIAGVPGWRMNSPIAALLSSAGLGVAFVALVDLVGDIESIDTFRWLLLILTIAYAVAAALLLGGRYRHAVQHVSAAGLAALGLILISFGTIVQGAFTSAFLGTGGEVSFNGPLGWELIGLVASAAVIAFAVVHREPGPGWIGVIALSSAVGIAAVPDGDGSLIGWPLVFILLALAAVAAVFLGGGGALPGRAGGDRPSRPRPPATEAAMASAPSGASRTADEPRPRSTDEPRPRTTDEPWASPDEPARPPRADDPGPPPPPPPAT